MTDKNQQQKKAAKEKEMEMAELNRLIGRGLKFKVERVKMIRRPGFFGRFRRPVKKTETLEFELHEPTLAVLDRLGAEGLEMEIDENVMSSSDGVSAARALTAKHAIRMARYVAIAVLGEDYTTPVDKGNGVIKYVEDRAKLKELTELFAHCIKPSQLYKLVIAINTIANMADFTNCIRLASSNRTTIPDRIQ